MTRLVIHAGATKTGSSAIQVGLAQNEAILRDHRIHVPRGGHFGKRVAGHTTGGNAQKVFRFLRRYSHSPDKEEALLREWLDAETELCGRQIEDWIISGEAFPGWFQGLAAERLEKIFVEYFSDIEIIYYVRTVVDHAASQYGEYIKRRGEIRDFNEFCETYEPPYRTALNNLESHFDPKDISVLSYDAVKQDLWGDFINRCFGRELPAIAPKTVNRSLSWEEIEFFRSLNTRGYRVPTIAQSVARYIEKIDASSSNRMPITKRNVADLTSTNGELLELVNSRLVDGHKLQISSANNERDLLDERPAVPLLPPQHVESFAHAALEALERSISRSGG